MVWAMEVVQLRYCKNIFVKAGKILSGSALFLNCTVFQQMCSCVRKLAEHCHGVARLCHEIKKCQVSETIVT